MDFHQDALEFARLSTKYRELVMKKSEGGASSASAGIESNKVMLEVRELINFNVQRLCSAFNIKLFKKATKFDKGKGIVVVASSIPNIIAKGDNLKMRDLTTLNPDSYKILDGVNIMLDYSGSMWFGGKRDCIGGNLRRIHAQNFLALVLVEYLKKVSRNKLKIIINNFCRESIITEVDITNVIDYDILLVHENWGSGVYESRKLMPKKLQEYKHTFFTHEDMHGAIQESLAKFTKKKMKNFITFFMTDGGLHRIGESGADRGKYLKDFLAKLQSLCNKTTTMFTFIKEQKMDTAILCKEAGIDVLTMNDVEEFNGCFEFFTQLINEARS